MALENHPQVSKQEWIEARKRLLAKEKEFTHMRDKLSEERRNLPWARVDDGYVFDTKSGKKTLAELFGPRSQLVVYHFMFDPDWEAGCKSCSFWADNFNGIVEHLKHRDVSFVAVSRAPLGKLTAYAKRMGWSFEWVSSHDNDFNRDFGVSFSPEQVASSELTYNFATSKAQETEREGTSVFFKDGSGAVFQTYSCYARGIDMLNTAYNYLDLVPKGRDEADLPWAMAWLKRRDEYGA